MSMSNAMDDIQEAIKQNNQRNGFWDVDVNRPETVAQKLALIHSEISEALEELRSGRDLCEIRMADDSGKPEGFTVELADAVIRIFDLASQVGEQNLGRVILQKVLYNASRPYRHGRQF